MRKARLKWSPTDGVVAPSLEALRMCTDMANGLEHDIVPTADLAALESRLAELACDLALMTHSRDSFREAVIAGEETRARAAELEAKATRLAAERNDYRDQRDEYRTRADRGEDRAEDRAAELEAALRALVEAMPMCSMERCEEKGTRTHNAQGYQWCDLHGAAIARVSGTAVPLRAALLLLGKGGK